MVDYKVISEAEWKACEPKPATKKRRSKKDKTVLLRTDSNGVEYYGSQPSKK